MICTAAGSVAAQDMPATAISPPQSSPQAPVPQPAPTPDPQQAAAQPTAAPPETSPVPAPGPVTPAANPLNKGQLEQLVAPVALYPDPLLSQVLMASTYPLEIVEADRWARDPAHQALKGDALTHALEAEHWDPSIMALVPFPRLLALMAERLQWTQSLGNAFLAQQADVMDAVQALRHDAMQAGNLKATPQCHCVIQTSGETISILPSDSQSVCVPVYNPQVVYGSWPVPEYPPYAFPIPVGFYFEPGYPIGFWPFIEVAGFGPLWGWWWLDWGGHSIGIDRGRYAALDPHPSFAGTAWVHDPAHRGAVAYGDPAVTTRFGAARVASVTAASRTAVGGTAAERGGAVVSGHFTAAATAGHFGPAATAGHVGAAATAGHFNGAAARFGGTAGHFGPAARAGGPIAHSFAAGRFGGAAHVSGGHAVSHASFGAAHIGGGAPHGGGGGAPHGGGGGAPHGGGGHH
jgi:hypothetical protein